ncbi:interleukin-31 receptor subunit alpha isoform X2 [Scleropages formosus]|uniref:interleukin-31 receptor subunit alpha isoform X2 n=1 Tax=Scleropages formosus TaxID=113540 RepID=UPI00087868FD|nr:interleukin-31 receptor subunit alpha-like isoform X2 [Scleropages formosus]
MQIELSCLSARCQQPSAAEALRSAAAVSKVAPSCFQHEHCHSSQHGVHELDCFQEVKSVYFNCVWKPGHQSSNKTSYTLVIEQKTRGLCKKYPNISGTFSYITIYRRYNITAYVVDTSNDGRNCTKAIFSGDPKNLIRCAPTKDVHFRRYLRQLEITASWKEPSVTYYVVQYRERNSLLWSKSAEILIKKSWTLGNLTASLSYEVQIQCVTNNQCSQCPWSETFLIPPELTARPVIEKLDVIPQGKGKRLVVVQWKLDSTEEADGYQMTITKASGERTQRVNTTLPWIRIILSGSAFNISIIAFNGAGTSPAVPAGVPPVDGSDWADTLNVTLVSETGFTIVWNSSLTKSFWCYSVEWWRMGEIPLSHSFYQRKENSATIPLKVPLQPYKRYTFLLHVRPDKDTCNLKSINNSESTCGRAEAYATEGTPISAPLNITALRVTTNSLVIEWTSIPEEDLRGFLLGYKIYYSEASQENRSSTVTVGPRGNTRRLPNLKARTVYSVSISAFTAAGEGVRSSPVYLKTKLPGDWNVIGATVGVTGGIIFLFLLAHSCNPLFHRAKALFWPSIPNPGNSNAIQKIDGIFDQEVLEPIIEGTTAQGKESDASSLIIIEDRGASEPTSASSPLLLQEVEDLSPAVLPKEENEASSRELKLNLTLTTNTHDLRSTTPAPCASDYTTMELFQQATALRTANHPSTAPADMDQQPPPLLLVVQASQPKDAAQIKEEKDYIQQSLCPNVVRIPHQW